MLIVQVVLWVVGVLIAFGAAMEAHALSHPRRWRVTAAGALWFLGIFAVPFPSGPDVPAPAPPMMPAPPFGAWDSLALLAALAALGVVAAVMVALTGLGSRLVQAWR